MKWTEAISKLRGLTTALRARGIEVGVDVSTATGWQSKTLNGADAELVLPAFGLRCRLGALDAGT